MTVFSYMHEVILNFAWLTGQQTTTKSISIRVERDRPWRRAVISPRAHSERKLSSDDSQNVMPITTKHHLCMMSVQSLMANVAIRNLSTSPSIWKPTRPTDAKWRAHSHQYLESSADDVCMTSPSPAARRACRNVPARQILTWYDLTKTAQRGTWNQPHKSQLNPSWFDLQSLYCCFQP